jgi:hypothetical protein
MDSNNGHNLNIHMYSLDEILGLFDLNYSISMEDLKRAKKRVLMTHPDKSRLSPDYFLFYKKAFDIVVQFYQNNNKQNQEVTAETTQYTPISNEYNKSTQTKLRTTINEMKPNEFNAKFNQLFDANMTNKINAQRNEWFSKEEPIYNIDSNVSAKNMGVVLDTIKQKNAELIRYQGVQEMRLNGVGTKLYEEAEDEADDVYITCDPFSKLKFDDLRKVHKDQTVFAVSERDIQNVPQYSSVDHYSRARSKDTLTPLDKEAATQMLAMKDKQYREDLMRKEHSARLKTMEYAEKNKTVLANFLRLK